MNILVFFGRSQLSISSPLFYFILNKLRKFIQQKNIMFVPSFTLQKSTFSLWRFPRIVFSVRANISLSR